jgi:hypothetical protein
MINPPLQISVNGKVTPLLPGTVKFLPAKNPQGITPEAAAPYLVSLIGDKESFRDRRNEANS